MAVFPSSFSCHGLLKSAIFFLCCVVSHALGGGSAFSISIIRPIVIESLTEKLDDNYVKHCNSFLICYPTLFYQLINLQLHGC